MKKIKKRSNINQIVRSKYKIPKSGQMLIHRGNQKQIPRKMRKKLINLKCTNKNIINYYMKQPKTTN